MLRNVLLGTLSSKNKCNMSEELTQKQLLSLVPYKGNLEGWAIWDFRRYKGWKLTKDEFAYFLVPENQIMSTASGEPVFNGDFFSGSRMDNVWERLDYPGIVLFVDHTEKIITILSASDEIKTRAWWLCAQSKYSQDWNHAKLLEIGRPIA